jgi:hypothetical protein
MPQNHPTKPSIWCPQNQHHLTNDFSHSLIWEGIATSQKPCGAIDSYKSARDLNQPVFATILYRGHLKQTHTLLFHFINNKNRPALTFGMNFSKWSTLKRTSSTFQRTLARIKFWTYNFDYGCQLCYLILKIKTSPNRSLISGISLGYI